MTDLAAIQWELGEEHAIVVEHSHLAYSERVEASRLMNSYPLSRQKVVWMEEVVGLVEQLVGEGQVLPSVVVHALGSWTPASWGLSAWMAAVVEEVSWPSSRDANWTS